ncbi:MAG: hypothetical protein C4576_35870 [Desulfobacteraceae bacterium]|nr:MAG: hypothetical protein C4576_35870 [Desulfobacteraceae bacterium]
MNQALLYIASAFLGFWGISHLLATKGAVASFGELSADNHRIITMEWISEGLALLSTAVFVAAVTAVDPKAAVSSIVYAVAIGTLIVFALVSIFTGFRVAFLPFRLCPFIFGISAALIAWGAWL